MKKTLWNVLRGMLSVFILFPLSIRDRVYIPSLEMTDAELMRLDWGHVRKDLHNAFNAVRAEADNEQAKPTRRDPYPWEP